MKDWMKKVVPWSGLIPLVVVGTCAALTLGTYTAPDLGEITVADAVNMEGEDSTEEATQTTTAKAEEEIPSVETIAEENGGYKDGTYTGSGTGYGGTTTVEVTIKDGKIADIQVLSHNDDSPFIDNAMALLDDIISKQSTNVDTVSGATYSSVGLITAVRDALSKAGGTQEETVAVTTEAKSEKSASAAPTAAKVTTPAGGYQDGTYTGSGTGYGGTTTVQVTVSGGKITDITVLNNHDDHPYFDNAEALLNNIIAQQSTNVDTVSGATYSSVGLITAVQDALSKAGSTESVTVTTEAKTTHATQELKPIETVTTPAGGYKDGTYVGEGYGYGGITKVQVVVKKGKISSAKILSHHDDSPFIDNASVLLDTIVSKQSTNVDTISGATYSSHGIIDGVRDALSQAENTSGGTTAKHTTLTTTTTKATTTKKKQTTTEPVTKGKYADYPDGTYKGTGEGYKSDITVSVTLKNGWITDVSIISSGDDEAFFSKASVLTDTVLDAQSVDVDTVSGATFSSNGILDAIADALDNAKKSNQKTTTTTTTTTTKTTTAPQTSAGPINSTSAGTTTETTTTTVAEKKRNGVYTVQAVCNPDDAEEFDPYTLQLEVTFTDGEITAIENVKGVSAGFDSSNTVYINLAANGNKRVTGLIPQILEKQSTTGVDAVSGATCSSKAILEAVADAIKQADADLK